MASVAIVGPNLLDQTKGDFHVHAAGCRDLKKAEYRLHRRDTDNALEVGSVKDVIEYIYADIIDQDIQEGNIPDTEDAWENYLVSVHFFPCTDDLPREA